MLRIAKKYFQGAFVEPGSEFLCLTETFVDLVLSEKDKSLLMKYIKIFFLGQLLGLPTLKSILTKFDKSNQRQTDFAKLAKRLSHSQIKLIFETAYEQYLIREFQEKAKKHTSNWSREQATVVLDDSVFMTWLSEQEAYEVTANCYGKFFSGQFAKVVFGFQAVCLGVVIDGIYYPLYFECAQKADKTDNEASKKAKGSKGVAVRLVQRWGTFYKKLQKLGIKIPQLFLSCDSGYSNKEILETCNANHLNYISVPKKAHVFGKYSTTVKLDAIVEDFLKREKKHLKTNNKEPFVYRTTAYYKCLGQDVVLLLFRLNGSKKVSVIYTTNMNTMAVTLRRNWFQRTYIEQFFKILKHVLKIQEARTCNKRDFDFKLFRFSLLALHTQKLVRVIRKSVKGSIPLGFQTLQRLFSDCANLYDMLNAYLK